MKNKIAAACIMLLSMLLVTGCWDNVELNDRHIILDAAVDKNDSGLYTVTYSIPDTGKLSGGESLGDEVKTVLSVDSPTIAKSINDVELKSQNTISFSHLKAILLGRSLMEDQVLFKTALDSFRENMEVGQGTYLLAVDGKAKEIASAKNYKNPIVGLYTLQFFKNEERSVGDCEDQCIGSFIKEMEETGVAAIPLIAADEEQSTLELGGAALIKDYKLAGWLSREEVRAKLLADGKIRNIPLVTQVNGRYYTYQIISEACKNTFSEQQGQLVINMDLTVDGALTEYVPQRINDSDNEKLLREVRQNLSDELIGELETGISKAQELNADFLHLSDELYRTHPELYKKYETLWEQKLFSSAQIKVNADVKIEGLGSM